MNITNEHGKALKDAYDDVLCGLGQYLFSILRSCNFLSHLVFFLINLLVMVCFIVFHFPW